MLVADSVHFLHLLLSYDVIFKFIWSPIFLFGVFGLHVGLISLD